MITQQVYRNIAGYRNTTFIDVLPDILSLDKSFIAKRFDKSRKTLFSEVSVVPLGDVASSQTRDVWNTTHGKVVEDESRLLHRLRNKIKQVIFDNWIPGHSHAIMHSSGLDSRMISWTIKQLHIEHGDEWLGNVLFLCSKWEGSEFRKIMEYEDWSENQYWIPRYDCDPVYYYEPSLTDFKNAWKWSNGVSAIPINLFWYPIQLAQESGILKRDNVQLFTGQWGNTTMDAGSSPDAGMAIKSIWIMFYWSVLFGRPMKGDMIIHPFADDSFAKSVAQSSVILGKNLRHKLLSSMDSRLAEFTNMNSDGDRHRKIADDIIDKMVDDYDNSWYGKRIHARPRYKTTEFQPFWSRWTAASLCEHLLECGYRIK